MPQEVRDHVGTLLLRITLRELFRWRFMQVSEAGGQWAPGAGEHEGSRMRGEKV
jgi:hypothetical protein